VTGRKYVGLTGLVPKRWGEHLSAARTGSQCPLHRAIRKHGVENFVVTCIETVTTSREDLIAAEIRQIAAHDCLAPKGYNLTPGGEGANPSPSTRKRMRDAARKRSSTPEWQKQFAEMIFKRSSDPGWIENHGRSMRIRSASSEWQNNQVEAGKRRAADPVWRKNVSDALYQWAEDPEWQKNHAEAMRKLATDPGWLKKNEPNLVKAREASRIKILARDALLSPEDQMRLARRREYERAWRARRKKRLARDS